MDRLFFESVVAVRAYANRQLAEIRLHPVDLGFGRPMSQRGRLMLADRTLANEILDGLGASPSRSAPASTWRTASA